MKQQGERSNRTIQYLEFVILDILDLISRSTAFALKVVLPICGALLMLAVKVPVKGVRCLWCNVMFAQSHKLPNTADCCNDPCRRT